MNKKIFITAEIGINHNGDMNTCKKLIDVAVQSGCDAVKFQKRNLEKVYTKEFLDSERESQWGNTQRDQKNRLEFNLSQYQEVDEYCKYKEIEWYASAWDIDSQNLLKQFNLKYNKIASAMIVDIELLNLVADEQKHTFISTGMSNFEIIDEAVKIFKNNNCPFELLHTVSTYPMKDEEANLSLISVLKKRYGCNVGYSGHETGLAISYAAAGLGISSLERHITLDKSMYGSDQAASLEPSALSKLVGGIRKVENCFGNGEKYITKNEKPIAEKLRQHIT